MFDLCTENVLKTRILSAFKSIQNHTCIKFEVSKLGSLNTSITEKFVVVFSNRGNRSVLYIKMLSVYTSTECETFQYSCIRSMFIIYTLIK